MRRFGKQILLSVILVQLIILPILVLAAKKQQEIRSRAAPAAQTPTEAFSEGNVDLSAGKDFSSEPITAPQARTTTTTRTTSTPLNPALKKDVYAYLPYWEVDAETDTYLQYKYMTHLIYHGISLGKNGVINKKNGPWGIWEGGRMKKIVENARASGVKVLPNIVLFNGASSGLNDFLDNPSARDKAVGEIISFLKTSPQPADGVAIDFEYPATAQKEELLDFMKKLRVKMKEYNPDWTLTIAVNGSSYAGGGFDLLKLSNEVDSFFVMSYHLRDPRNAEKAGSTNPIGALRNLTNKYLEKVPGDKIVLGFPLYLSEWKTLGDSQNAVKKSGTGGGKTVAENDCGLSGTTCTRLAQRYALTYGKKYDIKDKAAYYSFYVCTGNNKDKGWRQVYFDDEQAFTEKFALINNKNLRGIGFWAQNYDKGYLDTWTAIYNAFADKSLLPAPVKKPGFVNPTPIAHNGCVPPSSPSNPPSKTPTPTSTPTLTPTPPVTPAPGDTIVHFSSVKLHGIGTGGDNTNPNISGNLNPATPTRVLTVELYDTTGALSKSAQGNIVYSGSSGFFSGDIKLDSSIAPGSYLIKIKTDKYLRKQLSKIITITKGTTIEMPEATLIVGDSDSDGTLSILDYNIIIDCYSDLLPARNCSDPAKKSKADLSDDGKVNQDDYNLFLRELSVITGD